MRWPAYRLGFGGFENIEQVTTLDMENDVLEPDATVRSERRVFGVVPGEDFHSGQHSIMCA